MLLGCKEVLPAPARNPGLLRFWSLMIGIPLQMVPPCRKCRPLAAWNCCGARSDERLAKSSAGTMSMGMRTRRINEAVAMRVTVITTSMWFLYGLVLFVGLWMRFAPSLHLDTAPSYPVMLYWVNLFQALMLPVLAVGQSVLSRANEHRMVHEAEVIDRLDRLTQQILALEEEHAVGRVDHQAYAVAVMEQLNTIAQHLPVPSDGPSADA